MIFDNIYPPFSKYLWYQLCELRNDQQYDLTSCYADRQQKSDKLSITRKDEAIFTY